MQGSTLAQRPWLEPSPATLWNWAGKTLAPEPESAGVARDYTRTALARWGMGFYTDDAVAIVSELVTNAVEHAFPHWDAARSGQIRLYLVAVAGVFLRIVVTDPACDMPPVPRDAGPDVRDGRGLAVVEAYSDRWGWNPVREGGKAVYAVLVPHAP